MAAYPDANSSKIAANAVAIVKQIDERLALGLRTRGLMAEAASVQARDRSIGPALQEHDLKIGGNLLVMGGYGHSRVRDFVLGGATPRRLRPEKIARLDWHNDLSRLLMDVNEAVSAAADERGRAAVIRRMRRALEDKDA